MALINSGTLDYNGVRFTSMYNTKVSARPIQDEAQRTIAYITYLIDVEGWINATNEGDPSTDISLEAMRECLTAQGGALSFNSKGFGTLNVNTIGGVKDVKFGPFVRNFSWRPAGNDQTAFVTWQCETYVEECCYTDPKGPGFPLALNYESNKTVNEDGFLTFRTMGYLEIPMARISPTSGVLPDTVDAYKEMAMSAKSVPTGFKRVQQDFKKSKDKRRLDFVYTDQEVPVPLPNGVSRANLKHSFESAIGQGFHLWTSTISGSIIMTNGKNRALAFDIFLAIVNDRTKKSRKDGKVRGVILQNFRMEEEIFGQEVTMSATNHIIGAAFKEAFQASGMWQAIPGTDFAKWKTSLEASSANPRGFLKAKTNKNSDLIVDTCIGQVPPKPIAVLSTPKYPINIGNQQRERAQPPLATDPSVDVDPKYSWVMYQLTSRVIKHTPIARHKPLKLSNVGVPNQLVGGGALPGAAKGGVLAGAGGGVGALDVPNPGITGSPTPGALTPGAVPDVLQKPLAPSYQVVLSGYAFRFAYRIPVPELQSAGGVVAVETDRDVRERVAFAIGGIPIFYTAWDITYDLPSGFSTGLPMLSNPQLLTAGTSDSKIINSQNNEF